MANVLESARGLATLSWSSANPITGFRDSTHVDSLSLDVSPAVGAGNATQNYPLQGTLGPGASITINLNGITEPAFNQILNPSRFYMIVFKGVGATWSYSPGAVSGFGGFLSNPGTISGGAGEGFAFFGATALTIDGSHKNITILNTHGTLTLTYSLDTVLGA